MGVWEKFGQPFQNENHIPKIPNIPKNGVSGTPKGNFGDYGDIGDVHSSLKKEHGAGAQKDRYAPCHTQVVESRDQGEPGDQPAPISMRWILCPCTLVPVALELDAGGVLTWQAGQFDEHVRALCDEHGDRIRAFLEDMPGHRWESWQENALEAADRWEARRRRIP